MKKNKIIEKAIGLITSKEKEYINDDEVIRISNLIKEDKVVRKKVLKWIKKKT